MILRLDPRRPLVWRTPHSLQIGVDPVLAQLDDVSEGDARLVDALTVGVTRDGLAMLADRAIVPEDRVEAIIRALAPALVEANIAPAPSSAIAVIGSGLGARRIAAVLLEAGHAVTLTPSMTARPRCARPAIVVLVSTHVVDPIEHQRWLRRDIPHLPMVFGEAAVTVGPLVLPGESGCLACVEQRRTLDDPARPAIAAQLWGTAAAAETAPLATEAAVEALRLLRAGIPTPPLSTSVRLDAESGVRTVRQWRPSPQCGCRGISPWPEPAPRRGTGSVRVRRGPRSPVAPTTARAPFAHA
ncbi:hypothetical protein [Microcella humidisoli]|uniref:Bacteriocin biosynthesis cyclodehydratase domain-containing protein n=1 Tax=Microcella humidisoli TaxID=2963406 RepID=A0ABY5FUY9_9MICO|nr:hypothetical protein [Microcella humidisoli]UTT61757.1 hypothetical protein NNL39_08700 [Microcella humidisoli]